MKFPLWHVKKVKNLFQSLHKKKTNVSNQRKKKKKKPKNLSFKKKSYTTTISMLTWKTLFFFQYCVICYDTKAIMSIRLHENAAG